MKRFAKASTAGTTSRVDVSQTGLGFAFAIPGATVEAQENGAPSHHRPAARLALAATCALALLLALAAASASAAPENPFVKNFSPTFSKPAAMAVNQSTGDVLVIDTMEGTGTVSRWHEDGTAAPFSELGTNVIDGETRGPPCVPPSVNCDATDQNELNFSGGGAQVAVDESAGPTAGNIYVTQPVQPSTINIFSAGGKFLGLLSASSKGQFQGSICGVAVDPSGSIFVGDTAGEVHKFVPAANPPVNADNTANFVSPSAPLPCAIAAGAGPTAGYIFVNSNGGKVVKLDSTTGAEKYVVSPGANTIVSVNPANGRVFVAKGTGSISQVTVYDASGAGNASLISSFKPGSTVRGVAVHNSSSRIYVARTSIFPTTNVEIYGPAEPTLTINTAAGTGSGTVKCKVGAGAAETCKPKYPEGTELTLVPTADSGTTFAGFNSGTGSASGCTGTAPCTIIFKVESTLNAAFNLDPGRKNLAIIIVGVGEVKCNGGACAPNYLEGETITLTAIPQADQFFTWSAFSGSGAVATPCTGTISPCEVKFQNSVSGTATFAPITHALNLTTAGAGSVQCKVGSGPLGPCAASYNQGTTVKLKAVPANHNSFGGWSAFSGSGAVATPCTGVVTECEVKVDANVSGTATYAQVSALAEIGHLPGPTFPVTGEPSSMAVDESTGYVYVLNSAGNIQKFDSAGTPVNFAVSGTNLISGNCGGAGCRQIAVDNSGGINQGVVYASSNSTPEAVRVFLPSGLSGTAITNQSQLGGTSAPCGVAVDTKGVVYVQRPGGTGYVDLYGPGQWLPDAIPPQVWPFVGKLTPTLTGLCRTAVDSNGNLFSAGTTTASQFVAGTVWRYSATDIVSRTVNPAPRQIDTTSTYHAIDQTNNDLYSDQKTSIRRFDSAGALRETFGTGQLAESFGVAVNSKTGVVYATNKVAKTVRIFTPVATPGVATGAATASQTTATVAGHVEPAGAGSITACQFQYGTTTAYGSVAPCLPGAPYSEAKDITASLAGLSKETLYHYRITATNANGTSQGVDKTFTTHNVASVSSDAPTDVTQTSATLNGSFVGDGTPTTYYFEWGPTTAYGTKTAVPPGEPAGSPNGPMTVSAPITGLSAYLPASAPYHFRLVATNGSGTTLGPDRAFFSAPPDPPAISATTSSNVGTTTATVGAEINPGMGLTVFIVEYGHDTSYGASTLTFDSPSVGSDNTNHPVSQVLSGLAPGSTYHFRLVATNFAATVNGPDQVFNTLNLPIVSSSSASAITEHSASLRARINPGFSPTTYHFEYGVNSLDQHTAESTPSDSTNAIQDAAAELSGLAPGTTYQYRLVATNEVGVTSGPLQTFTTVATPIVTLASTPPPPVPCRKGFVKRHGKCVKRKKRHGKKQSRSATRRDG